MPLVLMGLMGALGIGSGSETGPRMEGYHLTADGNGHRSGSVRAAGAGGVEQGVWSCIPDRGRNGQPATDEV